MSKRKKQKKVLGRGLAALLDDSGSKSISFDKPKIILVHQKKLI